jgi:hypothetical protein
MLFMIRGDKITTHAAAPAKTPKNALLIGSAKELEASDLPAARLVAIWNALPGITPITKFKDRKTAARRLWSAFQELSPRARDEPRRTVATGSKQAQVIEMLRRAAGATIDEIAGATGWQRHSVRGMMSGALKKKLGLDVVPTKEVRGRVYRIAGAKKRAA